MADDRFHCSNFWLAPVSLWADYVSERLGHEVIEYDWGFAEFHAEQDVCLVDEFFIIPTERKSGKGRALMDEVAERACALACRRLWSQVWLLSKGADCALDAARAYGFKMCAAADNRIILIKEIGG